MAANAAGRSWARAERASLLEQQHLMTSAVSLLALNPLVWPAVLLAWLLSLSKKATDYPAVRTALYLTAVAWSQIVILSIRAVTPACFAVVALAVAAALDALPSALVPPPAVSSVWGALLRHPVLQAVALSYALVEVLFYFWTVRRAQRLQRRVVGPELDITRRWLAYRRVEQSSVFVLPMCMPRNCVYWRRFKGLRGGVQPLEPVPRSSTVQNLAIDTSMRNQHSASPFAADGELTPSSRYIDAQGRPLGRHAFRNNIPSPSPSPTAETMLLFGRSEDAIALAPNEESHPLEFLRGWFYNIPLKHIRHDNLMVFFAENSMGKHLHELTPSERAELEDVVRYIAIKLVKLQARQAKLRATRKEREHAAKTHHDKLARALGATAGAETGNEGKDAGKTQSAPPPRFSASVNARLPALQPPLLAGTAATSPVVPSSPAHASMLVMPRPRQQPRRGALRLLQPRVSSSARTLLSGSSSSPALLLPDALSSSAAYTTSASPSSTSSSLRTSSTSTDDDEEEDEEMGQEEDDASSDEELQDTADPEDQQRPASADTSRSAESTSTSQSSSSSSKDPVDWPAHVAAGTLPPGYDPAHDPMQLNLTPVTYLHRPLAIYAGVAALGALAGVYMRWLGFDRFQAGKIFYWYRRARRTAAEKAARTTPADPLVFIHGIGIGPTAYAHLFSQLFLVRNPATCSERSMYVLELPSISMRLQADDVPSPAEHVQAVADMLYRHEMDEREVLAMEASGGAGAGAPSSSSSSSSRRLTLEEVQSSAHPIRALIVSHSYGTFVSTWVVKHRPDLVGAVVLVDPVCFMVYDPSLIYNFIYRTPFSLVTRIYHYFTSKELGINYTLCRHFWWYENICWREELERLGMSSDELSASLIAEREQSVAALPYHEELLDDEELQREHEEDQKEELGECSADQQQGGFDFKPKNNSASAEGAVPHSSGVPVTAALQSPLAVASARASCAASLGLSEHPLCPSACPGLRVHVFLAANDDITPSASIHAYLSGAARLQQRKWGRSMLRCTVFPAIGHAEVLFHPRLRRVILDAVQTQPSDRELRKESRQQATGAAPV